MENQTKVCSGCGKEKSLDEFHVNKLCRLGRDSRCKECKRAQQKQQRAAARLAQAHDHPVPYIPEDAVTEAVERRREYEEARAAAARDLQELDVLPADATITLNFKGHENVLEWLSRTAAENFRNPDQQALFVLHQMAAAGNGGRS